MAETNTITQVSLNAILEKLKMLDTIQNTIEQNNKRWDEKFQMLDERHDKKCKQLDKKIQTVVENNNKELKIIDKKLQEIQINNQEIINNVTDKVNVIQKEYDDKFMLNKHHSEQCESGIINVDKQLNAEVSRINEVLDTRKQEIKTLECNVKKIIKESTPVKRIEHIYKPMDDMYTPVKFWGREKENPMKFLKQCQHVMESINDHMDDIDKIECVVKNLRGTASMWYNIVEDKINSYEEFIKLFRARFWNDEVQRKILTRLEFNKYSTTDGTKEDYVMQLLDVVKYLEPPMSEGIIINKIARHFDRNIQMSVVMQNINTLEGMLIFLSRWDSIEARKYNGTYTNPRPPDECHKQELNKYSSPQNYQKKLDTGQNKDKGYSSRKFVACVENNHT